MINYLYFECSLLFILVRYVIHHSMPKSLTNYYQESGRAGRDGEVADCILYFAYKDKAKLSHMIMKSGEERGMQPKSYENQRRGMHSLNRCLAYCLDEGECRRVLLLEYFGEKFSRQLCQGTCDNCEYQLKNPTSIVQKDYTSVARSVLNVVRKINSDATAQRLTLIKLSKLCSQSKDKELVKYLGFISPAEAQIFASTNRDMCERIIQYMIIQQYLNEEHQISFGQFGADYVVLGERAHELERETLTFAVREKVVNYVPERKKAADIAASRGPLREIENIESWNTSSDEESAVKPKESKARKRKVEQPPNVIEIAEDKDKDKKTKAAREMDIDTHANIPSLLSNKQKVEFTIWLEDYRKKWVNYWNYLNNYCISEIVRKVPLSIEELASISGVGDTKARNHGEGILATIYAFLEAHDILHLFPRAKPPTIPECPTWRAPSSPEAQSIRDLNKEPSRTSIAAASPAVRLPANNRYSISPQVETQFN